MNTRFLILSFLVIVVSASRCESDPNTPIHIRNNSEYTILSYLPLIGDKGGLYPDTTISFTKNQIGYTIASGKYMSRGLSNISLENWMKSFPKDTVSFYVFDKEVLDNYSWETIQKDYMILQRYDLSLEDFYELTNEYGIPVLSFPPTELMKGMKMYPPYGTWK